MNRLSEHKRHQLFLDRIQRLGLPMKTPPLNRLDLTRPGSMLRMDVRDPSSIKGVGCTLELIKTGSIRNLKTMVGVPDKIASKRSISIRPTWTRTAAGTSFPAQWIRSTKASSSASPAPDDLAHRFLAAAYLFGDSSLLPADTDALLDHYFGEYEVPVVTVNEIDVGPNSVLYVDSSNICMFASAYVRIHTTGRIVFNESATLHLVTVEQYN